jgi:ABC-2 type transport system ATP-binding protein
LSAVPAPETPALWAESLGKRYGKVWGLRDCSLTIPAGRIVGLVGANGAGKTTLLNLAVGLLSPTTGSIRVLGDVPSGSAEQLARIGFVGQASPLYDGMTVADHLGFGKRLNPRWNGKAARERLERLGIDLARKTGSLSGGQRAQVALALAVAKQPDLLLLDEPLASLDPLARREFLQSLMEAAAERELAIVLSSHLLVDLERVCDHLVVLSGGEVRLAGDVDDLLATHRTLVGPRRSPDAFPSNQTVLVESHTDRQTTAVVRTEAPVLDPAWQVLEIGLEDLVLAYLGLAASAPLPKALRTVGSAP